MSVVRSSTSPQWAKGTITYEIFDIPSYGSDPFEDRLAKLETLFGTNGKYKSDFVNVVKNTEVKDKDHVFTMLKDIESQGGEGLMLRKPKS